MHVNQQFSYHWNSTSIVLLCWEESYYYISGTLLSSKKIVKSMDIVFLRRLLEDGWYSIVMWLKGKIVNSIDFFFLRSSLDNCKKGEDVITTSTELDYNSVFNTTVTIIGCSKIPFIALSIVDLSVLFIDMLCTIFHWKKIASLL